ncbi:hypothetical protein C0584_04190 [Candidatus Parcubacteria bacterium]|nr:MAG: hypothetical protein C0584_04190 [Candidatus Parcubacteria bacterium]
MAEEVVLRFDNVSFEYLHKKPILKNANFSVRKGSKITLMGQNGAGKSTIFDLIEGKIKPKSGKVSVQSEATIGTAKQTVDRADLDLTVEKYFENAFEVIPPGIKSEISKVMDAVNLDVPVDRRVGDLSGGQQARLLLAFALIQNPDILLLDEPTNNLDDVGIGHLIEFLIMYDKTVIVISHDADFLNCFTEGVVYLDIYKQVTEVYVGDYYSVVEEIANRIERERMNNARMEKMIKDRKEKVNFFALKGGKMRKLAKKMKEETKELEENMVDIRKDDKTIRDFTIPMQEIKGEIVQINSVKLIKNHEPVVVKTERILRKGTHMIVSGPNGIGKSTFLRSLVSDKNEGVKIQDGVLIGYYSQDFANLDYNQKVFDSLKSAMINEDDDQKLRAVAASFLLTGSFMEHKVSDLSEGQKGLLSFARLVLMKPGLLILDEPTNHINFRHLPIIAKAINEFEGAVIFVSHMEDFVKDIRIDEYLELGKM